MPEREDFDSDDAWMDAVEKWEDGEEPAQPGTKPPTEQQEKPAAQDTPPPTDQPPPRNAAQAEAEMLFTDLQEAMDDLEEAPETLAADFFNMIRQQPVRMSRAMLVHMADADDDGARIAQKFVESPRAYRRILRLPESQQGQAMNDLLNKPAASKKASTPSAPDIKPLGGEADPPRKELAEAKDFAEYEQIYNQTPRREKAGFYDI